MSSKTCEMWYVNGGAVYTSRINVSLYLIERLIRAPDEHHPTCKRCEKASYTCEGYLDRNFIIFDSTIKHENATQSYKSNKTSDTQSDTSEVITDFNSLTPRSTSTKLTVFNGAGSPVSEMPLLLSPIVDREELYTSFMYKYFYRGATARLKLFDTPGADIKAQNSLAALSSGALATSFFGFKTGTHAIMMDGYRQYGVALTKLNHALSHRSPKDDCDVLAAIVMLCLYEVYQFHHFLPMERLIFIVHDACEYHRMDQPCLGSWCYVQTTRPRDMFSDSVPHIF